MPKHIPVDMIESNLQIQSLVRTYLSYMEYLSVGINTGVYDIYVFDRLSGSRTVKRFRVLRAYLEKRREETHHPQLGIDFERMVEELKKIRTPLPIPSESLSKIRYEVTR